MIKPLLLHNYDMELHKMKQEFFELLNRQGVELEEEFIQREKHERSVDKIRTS